MITGKKVDKFTRQILVRRAKKIALLQILEEIIEKYDCSLRNTESVNQKIIINRNDLQNCGHAIAVGNRYNILGSVILEPQIIIQVEGTENFERASEIAEKITAATRYTVTVIIVSKRRRYQEQCSFCDPFHT